MQHIIVGIDGGKTAAVACLDLNGNKLATFTGRSVGIKWFIDKIREQGVPVLIASDKEKPDYIAYKLSAMFGAALFTPKSDISTERKRTIAGGTENLHERDALAAAKTAYNAYANKLKQADRLAHKQGANADMVKALVIRHYSIDEAITGKKSGRK